MTNQIQIVPIHRLAEQCYENSKAKGFWQEGANRSKSRMIVLMITELSEAIEYDRTYKWFKDIPNATYGKDFKNTVEEEMADTFIRVLDYMYGWQIGMIECRMMPAKKGEDFAEDVLWCMDNITTAARLNNREMWNHVLSSIYTVCEWHQIDLFHFIDLKMKYNITRPYLHGNKKY